MAELLGACRCGDINKVKELLKRGCVDINFQDEDGDTALIKASYCGHTEMIELLLNYSTCAKCKYVDPNLQNIYGNTALIFASSKGHIEIVKLLLNYKKISVNPNIQNLWGNNALLLASDHDYIEIENLLKNYIYYRKNIDEFILSYNILLSILINKRELINIPNEMILLIKECGLVMCGKYSFQ